MPEMPLFEVLQRGVGGEGIDRGLPQAVESDQEQEMRHHPDNRSDRLPLLHLARPEDHLTPLHADFSGWQQGRLAAQGLPVVSRKREATADRRSDRCHRREEREHHARATRVRENRIRHRAADK